LPFVRDPVTANETLASTIEAAFRLGPEPLAIDGLILCLARLRLRPTRHADGTRWRNMVDHEAGGQGSYLTCWPATVG
jgi:hypothetical protein